MTKKFDPPSFQKKVLTFLSLSWAARWWSSSLLLALLIVIGFGLRVYRLDTSPKGALIDEAHFGYIAYSLLQTGKDEHGVAWPLIFKGFGDQKLPAYGYALLPVVKTLGLSVFSIRVPSLLAGTALIGVLFLVARAMGLSRSWSATAAFLMVANPWPYFLSRMGFESNLALLFFAFGLWALLKSFSSARRRWVLISAMCWGLTWYAYVAYRPITVVVAGVIWGFLWWRGQKTWRQVASWGVIFGLTVLPLFSPWAIRSNTTRFNQVNLLADHGLVAEIDENRTFCADQFPRLVCDVFWNKATVISHLLVKRFVHTYSPQNLATAGEEGIQFLTVKDTGQFFFILYPFFILGLLALINPPRTFSLTPAVRTTLLAGLLLTPLPTMLVGEAQKVRISALLPFVLLVMVLGLKTAYDFVPRLVWRRALMAGLIIFMAINSIDYMINFWSIHTIKHDYYYQSYLSDTYDHLAQYDQNARILIKPFFSDPIMFYAFYRNIDPVFYQQNAVLGELEPSGFQHTVKLANYEIKDDSVKRLACEAQRSGQKTVFVTNIKEDGDFTTAIHSLNGALQYVFIYDMDRYLIKHPDVCAGIP